jgi:hypothetical protein
MIVPVHHRFRPSNQTLSLPTAFYFLSHYTHLTESRKAIQNGHVTLFPDILSDWGQANLLTTRECFLNGTEASGYVIDFVAKAIYPITNIFDRLL